MTHSQGTNSAMLECEFHNGSSKTKQLAPIQLDLPAFFWKSKCNMHVVPCDQVMQRACHLCHIMSFVYATVTVQHV